MLMRKCVLSGWNKEHENEALFFCGRLSLFLLDLFFIIFLHHFDYVINKKRPKDSINSH